MPNMSNINYEILKQDLKDSVYDGRSLNDAYSWLTTPTVTVTMMYYDTPVSLDPPLIAKTIGIKAAEAIASAFREAYPNIADYIIADGPDIKDPATVALLESMVVNAVITQDQVDKLKALTKTMVQTEEHHDSPMVARFSATACAKLRRDAGLPPQSDELFVDNSTVPPRYIHGEEGFPNVIPFEDFATAWSEVRP